MQYRTHALALLVFAVAALGRAEITTASLVARLSEPPPPILPCPGGPETDLWVLAGQSNMEGRARIEAQDLAPAPDVWTLAPFLEWQPAAEPLFRPFESRFAAHRRKMSMTLNEQAGHWLQSINAESALGQNFMGPGLHFARQIQPVVMRPIGLIPCAHGGTSLDEWTPDGLQTSGTASLYGAMIAKIKLATVEPRGGRLRGLLWYQGESDAVQTTGGVVRAADGTTRTLLAEYTRKFKNFVAAVRRDSGVPDLPVLTVQLARVVKKSNVWEPAWEQVREAQRRMPQEIAGVYVIPAVDLTLHDPIHLNSAAQRMVGRRLGELALNKVYGLTRAASPIEVGEITARQIDPKIQKNLFTVRIRFSGVNGKLASAGPISGFSLRGSPGHPRGSEVFHVDLDPDDPGAVLLRVLGPWTTQTTVIYGPGLAPYCNLVDESGMAVPAFGPVAVPDPRS